MMFTTIQDTSGSLELLVFPRTYETTKDAWVDGQMVCVVGRTSEQEGDDKLFVERAYVLNEANAAALTKQLAINSGEHSLRQYAPQLAEENNLGVEITVLASELKSSSRRD